MYRENFCTLVRRMLPMSTSRKGESHGRVKVFLRHAGVFLCLLIPNIEYLSGAVTIMTM